jgi:hypothetical protein
LDWRANKRTHETMEKKRGLSRKARRKELRRALALAEAALWAVSELQSAKSNYAWGWSRAEMQLREELLWNPEHPGHDEFWPLVEAATEPALQQLLEAKEADNSAYAELRAQLERMRSMGGKVAKDADSVDFSHRAREFRITSTYL